MLYCNQTYCSCLVCSSENFRPGLGASITKELLDFYAQLGWRAADLEELANSSLASLSSKELVILLEEEIGQFLDRCHPLFLALVKAKLHPMTK